MLRNLRCWLFASPPVFPFWLLTGDRVTIDGRNFVYRGWPRRVRDRKALIAAVGRSS